MAPLQPYESPHDYLVCFQFSDGEFESLVKPDPAKAGPTLGVVVVVVVVKLKVYSSLRNEN